MIEIAVNVAIGMTADGDTPHDVIVARIGLSETVQPPDAVEDARGLADWRALTDAALERIISEAHHASREQLRQAIERVIGAAE